MDRKILDKADQANREVTTGDLRLLSARIIGETDQPVATVQSGQNVDVELKIDVMRPIKQPVFALGVHTTDFVYITTKRWRDMFFDDQTLAPGQYTLRCSIANLTLLPGVYCLRLIVEAGPFSKMTYLLENMLSFRVELYSDFQAGDESEGFFDVSMDWKCLPEAAPASE